MKIFVYQILFFSEQKKIKIKIKMDKKATIQKKKID